tara:strand:+ start:17632 stop:18246 length:615 start_codon:yes stop_codon:yes gene_type:complete
MQHEKVEKNIGLMMVLIVIAISLGGLTEIVPLFFQKQTQEAVPNLKPLAALELEGRDIYIREGCHVCHSQMVRTLHSETLRYGHYSLAGEHVYEHPFLWGSKRTGPDLARVGKRYSDDWHRVHLINPRDVSPTSNMPAYPWLEKTIVSNMHIQKKMKVFRTMGVPYSDEDIENAPKALEGKTELDAMVAYLQQLGTVMSQKVGS